MLDDVTRRRRLRQGPFLVCDGVSGEEAKALLNYEEITSYGVQYENGSLLVCGDNTHFHGQARMWMAATLIPETGMRRVCFGFPHLILSSGVIKKVDFGAKSSDGFVEPIVVGEVAFTSEDDAILEKNSLALESVNLVFGFSLEYDEMARKGSYKFFVGCRSWGKDTIRSFSKPNQDDFPR